MTTASVARLDSAVIASALGLPRVEVLRRVPSTMDEVHRLGAEGAPAGTLVIADEQTAGRGRTGKRWNSAPGHGLWLTLLERPDSGSGLDVLSLRLGLRAAPVLEVFGARRVRLKWPNDLFDDSGKLAGVLVEARWRGRTAEWVAIGVGVNLVAPPGLRTAACLPPGTSREALVLALVPALRDAASARGPLADAELAEFGRRDFARDRRCVKPAEGIASGITNDGALIVTGRLGVQHFRAGSLEFDTAGEEP